MRAGIYGVAGSVTWFWDRPLWTLMHDTSLVTHYPNVDTLYHSDDLTISFCEIAHGREGCAKGRTYLGCGLFFASSFFTRRRYFFILLFCFYTRIASGACFLHFSVVLAACIKLGRIRLTLHSPQISQVLG